MHPARWTGISLCTAILSISACSDSFAPSPHVRPLGGTVVTSGAVRTHVEFTQFDDNDFPLSCLGGEMTHWQGTVHVTLDVITTKAGLTQERIHVAFEDDYYMERANGVRYYPVGPFPVNEHHLFGPVTVIAGTAAGAWRSAAGDVLALGFHAQFVYDKNGNPILERFVGACP